MRDHEPLSSRTLIYLPKEKNWNSFFSKIQYKFDSECLSVFSLIGGLYVSVQACYFVLNSPWSYQRVQNLLPRSLECDRQHRNVYSHHWLLIRLLFGCLSSKSSYHHCLFSCNRPFCILRSWRSASHSRKRIFPRPPQKPRYQEMILKKRYHPLMC